MEIIQADEQGVAERRLFDQGLDVLKQPESLLRGGMQVAEGLARYEGLVAVEQRVKEGVQL